MTPESPPSAAPKANTPVNTRSVLIPSPAAISASNPPARMMAPSRVFWISRPRARAPASHEGADQPDGQGRHEQRHPEVTGRSDQREAGVRAEHVEGAVREVDDVEHAEDQREADGEQEQQHAVGEAVQRLTEEVREEGHARA